MTTYHKVEDDPESDTSSERANDFANVDSEENIGLRKSTKDLTRRYLDMLDAHPLATKSISAASLGALGAVIGSTISSHGSGAGKRRMKKNAGIPLWQDVIAYAVLGAVQGPLGHYWYCWWDDHGPESKSNSMLLDQILIQPPMIVLMYVTLDIVKAALKEVGPSIYRSLSAVGPVVATSWRFWPLALYLSGRIIKKRKNHALALKLWSLLWTIYTCKQRRSNDV